MHVLTVLYPMPDDPAAFRAYYEGTHVPLARALPGIRSVRFGYPEPLGPGDPPYFCIFEAEFDNAATMQEALKSDIGAKVAADVPNYSPKGASIFHYAAKRD
jgi:uncharacterized protein (TIGR02118 family)